MKLAVIGTGYWGANLVRNFASLGVLDSICDLNSRRAAEITFEYGVRFAAHTTRSSMTIHFKR